MGKVIDITDILAFRKAVRILELLDKDYNYDMLKSHPNICREIVVLFGKQLEKADDTTDELITKS